VNNNPGNRHARRAVSANIRHARRAQASVNRKHDKVTNMNKIETTPEIRKALDEQHALCVKTFGRNPSPTDPFIWDEECTDRPVELPIDRSEIAFSTFCDKAEKLGLISHEVAYAMRKTRLNPQKLVAADASAWNAAVEEYRSKNA
jgi:hypothetical protein